MELKTILGYVVGKNVPTQKNKNKKSTEYIVIPSEMDVGKNTSIYLASVYWMSLLCPPLSAMSMLSHHITLPPDPDCGVPRNSILVTCLQEVVAAPPCLAFSQLASSFHVPKCPGTHVVHVISQKELEHGLSPPHVQQGDGEEEVKRCATPLSMHSWSASGFELHFPAFPSLYSSRFSLAKHLWSKR